MTVLKSIDQVHRRRSHHWDLSDLILMIWLGLYIGFGGEEDHRGRVTFSPHCGKGVYTINMLYSYWWWPWSTGWNSSVCQFLHCTVLFLPSPFPHCTLGEEVTMYSPQLRNSVLSFTSLRVEYLHKLFGILLHRRFASSPRLLIYPVIYSC